MDIVELDMADMAFNWKRIMIQGEANNGLFRFTVAEDGGYTFDLVIPEANKMFTEALTPDQVIQRYVCSNRQAVACDNCTLFYYF